MSKIKKQINEEDIVVKLKPVKGIKPGVYLSVIYGIIIISVLFLVFVFPGLKKPGTLVQFKTAPEKSIVYVDGFYRGTTPCSIFIEKGDHGIILEKEFYDKINIDKSFKGRILFSIIFPRKESFVQKMKLNDPAGFLQKRYMDIGGYALMRDFFEGYQYPPLITETVSEYLAGETDGNRKLLYDFLYSMRLQLGNPEIVKDLAAAVRAVFPENSENKSDYSVIKSFFQANGYSVENLVFGYLNSFPEKDREKVIASDKEVSKDYNSTKHVIPSDTLSPDNFKEKHISLSGIIYTRIPSGEFLAGNSDYNDEAGMLSDKVMSNFPHKEKIDSFYIMNGEVTVEQFRRFTKYNPEWSLSSKELLIQKGYVNDDYLTGIDSEKRTLPVAYVSWYAAEAFCNWMTRNLPEEFSGFEVRLPTEAEWEWTARLNYSKDSTKIFKRKDIKGPVSSVFSRQGKMFITDMLGNLWEWTDNYYFPADTVFGQYGNKGSSFSGNEKAVRGGSWANRTSEISVSTRGSQPPSWCTPFLGFRTVLVKKGN